MCCSGSENSRRYSNDNISSCTHRHVRMYDTALPRGYRWLPMFNPLKTARIPYSATHSLAALGVCVQGATGATGGIYVRYRVGGGGEAKRGKDFLRSTPRAASRHKRRAFASVFQRDPDVAGTTRDTTRATDVIPESSESLWTGDRRSVAAKLPTPSSRLPRVRARSEPPSGPGRSRWRRAIVYADTYVQIAPRVTTVVCRGSRNRR